jgi:hypothetical protein
VSIRLSATLNGQVRNSPIRLRYGDSVDLGAVAEPPGPTPNGAWRHNTAIIPGGIDPSTARVTMSRDQREKGVYTFTPEDQAQPVMPAQIEVRFDSWWTRANNLPGKIGMIGAIVLSVAVIEFMLSGRFFSFDWKLRDTQDAYTVRSYVMAATTILLFLVLVHLTGKISSVGRSGLAALFVGADLRASTSKVQYLTWTFVLGFILSYIAARTFMGHTAFECVSDATSSPAPKNCVPPDQWGSYLLLLGVPAGAAVAAKGLVSYKVQNGIVQKSDSTSGAAVSDLATNDAGAPDLVDTQYLLFNIIVVAYVLATFFGRGSLPAIPNLLLGLTSTAAATYVLNKSLQSNKPVITSVVPSAFPAGASLLISGTNLFPDGAPSENVTVKIGGVQTVGRRVRGRSTDTISAVAPAGMSTQDQTVRVVTAAQVETDGFPVSFVNMKVIGWQQAAPPPRAGSVKAVLAVSGLPAGAGPAPRVRVGGVVVDATQSNDGSTVEFTLPAINKDQTEVQLLWKEKESEALTVGLGP